ncbi:YcbK family protein [Foliimonas ilicis]|uniref:YcbK family protein n=1 Tax=Mesorhizobium sp. SB112 TaxID=3151853 RepID=UPI0032652B26
MSKIDRRAVFGDAGMKHRKGTGLRVSGSVNVNGKGRVVLAALFSVLVASCSSTGDPNLDLAPGFSANGAGQAASPTGTITGSIDPSQSANLTMSEEGDTDLPGEVAYVPAIRPGGESEAVQQLAAQDAPATAAVPANAPAATSDRASAGAAPAATATAKAEPAQVATAAPAAEGTYVEAAEFPEAKPMEAKKKGFLASFFGASNANAAPSPAAAKPKAAPQPAQAQQAAKPIITLASAEPAEKPLVNLASASSSASSSDNALPGVRQHALFEIKRKSGIDDDSDVDLHEGDDDDGSYQVASAAGLARLTPNGLLKQTESVDVACLKPSLVRVLKTIEQRYGKKVVVTSGFRNPERNRRARGAKNSLHMYCAAADIQVAGVSKWDLAQYVRTMPGRGGVGTYCHTESVHVDVGPERDWNWRCRRRK